MAASEWREMLQEATSHYANTRDGAPPFEVLEGLMQLESGGDPGAQGPPTPYGPAQGLMQIVEGGLDWGLWLGPEGDYARSHVDDPYNVWDPETNIEVVTFAINWRQEQGRDPNLFPDANKPYIGAMSNWYVAATSYFGAANNAGINSASDVLGTDGHTYAQTIYDYVSKTFGEDRAREIDDMYSPEVTDLDPGEGGIGLPSVPKIPDPTDAIGDWLRDLAKDVRTLLQRGGLFVAGLILLGLGVKRFVA